MPEVKLWLRYVRNRDQNLQTRQDSGPTVYEGLCPTQELETWSRESDLYFNNLPSMALSTRPGVESTQQPSFNLGGCVNIVLKTDFMKGSWFNVLYKHRDSRPLFIHPGLLLWVVAATLLQAMNLFIVAM